MKCLISLVWAFATTLALDEEECWKQVQVFHHNLIPEIIAGPPSVQVVMHCYAKCGVSSDARAALKLDFEKEDPTSPQKKRKKELLAWVDKNKAKDDDVRIGNACYSSCITASFSAPLLAACGMEQLGDWLQCPRRCEDQQTWLTVQTPDDVAEAARQMKECGYVRLRSPFPASLVNETAQSAKILTSQPVRRKQFEFLATLRNGRNGFVAPFEKPFNNRSLAMNRVILDILAATMGEKYTVRFDNAFLVEAPAGIGQQDIHRDISQKIVAEMGQSPHDTAAVKVQVALERIDAARSPLMLCPCTHTRDAARFSSLSFLGVQRCTNPVYGMREAGDVVIYNQFLHHAGMANSADNDRIVYDISYVNSDNLLQMMEKRWSFNAPPHGLNDINRYRSMSRPSAIAAEYADIAAYIDFFDDDFDIDAELGKELAGMTESDMKVLSNGESAGGSADRASAGTGGYPGGAGLIVGEKPVQEEWTREL